MVREEEEAAEEREREALQGGRARIQEQGDEMEWGVGGEGENHSSIASAAEMLMLIV